MHSKKKNESEKDRTRKVENHSWLDDLGQTRQAQVERRLLKKKMVKRRGQPPRRKRRKQQRGRGVDVQKWIFKLGIEFHPPGYLYMGPGTQLEKRLIRGDPGKNRHRLFESQEHS